MDDLPEKVSLYVMFGALVQKLIVRDDASGLFGFGTLAENASIFERDRGTKYCLNGQ